MNKRATSIWGRFQTRKSYNLAFHFCKDFYFCGVFSNKPSMLNVTLNIHLTSKPFKNTCFYWMTYFSTHLTRPDSKPCIFGWEPYIKCIQDGVVFLNLTARSSKWESMCSPSPLSKGGWRVEGESWIGSSCQLPSFDG